MSKRIFTVILALVLSLTALSFGAWADSLNPTIQKRDGAAVIVRWSPVSGASTYAVQLIRNGGESTGYSSATSVHPYPDNSNLFANFWNLSGGSYTAKVSAYNANNVLLATETTASSVSIPFIGGSASYKITLSEITGNINIFWDAYKPSADEVGQMVTYDVEYTYKNASGESQSAQVESGTATSVDISIGDSTLTNVTVYYVVGSEARKTLTSMWSDANVWIDYITYCLRWINQDNQPHYVRAYLIDGTSFGNAGPIYDGYCNIQSIVAQYGGVDICFDVYCGGLPNYGGSLVGSATYHPQYYQQNPQTGIGYEFTVTVSGSVANIDWSYYPNIGYTVSQYLVNYIVNGEKKTEALYNAETSINLPWVGGLMIDVMVFNGSYYQSIGTATVDRDGTVIYNTGANENSIIGDNCVMSVGTYTSSLIWNASNDIERYEIVYTDNVTGSTRTLQVGSYGYYNNPNVSASIPLGYSISTDFNASVIGYSSTGQPNEVASVAYKGTSSGQTPTPTVCEHTFEYQSCTEVHWKHCTKCGYTCEVGEHSAANGSCSVCGRSSTSSRFDVNGNGHVDLQDAVMILRRLAHLD